MEIWEPKPPGNLWATPGLLRDYFTFYINIYVIYLTSNSAQWQATVNLVIKFKIA